MLLFFLVALTYQQANVNFATSHFAQVRGWGGHLCLSARRACLTAHCAAVPESPACGSLLPVCCFQPGAAVPSGCHCAPAMPCFADLSCCCSCPAAAGLQCALHQCRLPVDHSGWPAAAGAPRLWCSKRVLMLLGLPSRASCVAFQPQLHVLHKPMCRGAAFLKLLQPIRSSPNLQMRFCHQLPTLLTCFLFNVGVIPQFCRRYHSDLEPRYCAGVAACWPQEQPADFTASHPVHWLPMQQVHVGCTRVR